MCEQTRELEKRWVHERKIVLFLNQTTVQFYWLSCHSFLLYYLSILLRLICIDGPSLIKYKKGKGNPLKKKRWNRLKRKFHAGLYEWNFLFLFLFSFFPHFPKCQDRYLTRFTEFPINIKYNICFIIDRHIIQSILYILILLMLCNQIQLSWSTINRIKNQIVCLFCANILVEIRHPPRPWWWSRGQRLSSARLVTGGGVHRRQSFLVFAFISIYQRPTI